MTRLCHKIFVSFNKCANGPKLYHHLLNSIFLDKHLSVVFFVFGSSLHYVKHRKHFLFKIKAICKDYKRIKLIFQKKCCVHESTELKLSILWRNPAIISKSIESSRYFFVSSIHINFFRVFETNFGCCSKKIFFVIKNLLRVFTLLFGKVSRLFENIEFDANRSSDVERFLNCTLSRNHLSFLWLILTRFLIVNSEEDSNACPHQP